MNDNAIFSHEFFLTAGECNAEGRMPYTLLVSRLIEVATEHANTLGIGYAKLIELNLAWVLSRVSVVIDSLPPINTSYRLETWIETSNRLFSERCFCLRDQSGKAITHARTTWAAIDITSRRPANLAVLGDVLFPDSAPDCPVEPAKHVVQMSDKATESTHTWHYCDLDFNRHVNTIRYVELILNYWPLSWHDSHKIDRIDLAFHHECRFDEPATLKADTSNTTYASFEILSTGRRAATALLSTTSLQ